MIQRILASLILLFSILYMPFWLSVILALAGMAYFSFFWEATVLFLLSDLLYGVSEARFFNIFFISFLTSLLVLILIEMVKRKLRA